MIRQSDNNAFTKRPDRRVRDRLAAILVDDSKYVVQWTAERLLLRPARDRFGHGIHEGHASLHIGRDDRVANAEKRDPQKLAPFVRLRLRPAGRFTKHDDQPTGDEIREHADQSGNTAH